MLHRFVEDAIQRRVVCADRTGLGFVPHLRFAPRGKLPHQCVVDASDVVFAKERSEVVVDGDDVILKDRLALASLQSIIHSLLRQLSHLREAFADDGKTFLVSKSRTQIKITCCFLRLVQVALLGRHSQPLTTNAKSRLPGRATWSQR